MALSYSVTQSSISTTWSSHGISGNNVISYNIELYRSGSLVASAYNLSPDSRSYYFGGLTSGTSYSVKMYSQRQTDNVVEWVYPTTDSAPLPSPPATPTNFRLYDNQPASLSLAWNTVSGANNYVVEVYHASTGSLVWSNYNISGGSVIASGLADGVTYNVKLYASNLGGNSSPTWLYAVRAGKNRPANFSWITTKSRGSSYNISNSKVTNLIAQSEVVALQTRINEFRLYKGLTATSFTSRTVGEVFTSTMYNQLSSAITGMSPPIYPSGSSNLIDLLNGLRDSLNSIT